MIFETEEGARRAEYFNSTCEKNDELAGLQVLLGETIRIKTAPEPSDIIWENRHYSKWDRRKKEIIVGVLLTLMLIGSFIIMFRF